MTVSLNSTETRTTPHDSVRILLKNASPHCNCCRSKSEPNFIMLAGQFLIKASALKTLSTGDFESNGMYRQPPEKTKDRSIRTTQVRAVQLR